MYYTVICYIYRRVFSGNIKAYWINICRVCPLNQKPYFFMVKDRLGFKTSLTQEEITIET